MKVLIIGFGSIGRRHAEILSNISVVGEIHVVSKQSELDFITYSSLEEVLELNSFDYFIIASITSLHVSQLKFLNDNLSDKIILVEKPIGMKSFDLYPVNRIFVAYNLRFHPFILKLKEMLQNETVISVNIQAGQYLPSWRPERDYKNTYSAASIDGGGVLLDLSHEIDYLLWLFGDIESISSINDKISDLSIQSDDYVTAIGRMKSGAVFNITMDYISKIYKRSILINTISKTIEADLINNNFSYSDNSCQKNSIFFPDFTRNSTYKKMHKQLLGLESNNMVATLGDGQKVLSVVEMIREDNYGK